MDQRERNADPEEALRVAIQGHMTGVWTAIPCLVESYSILDGVPVISAQPVVKTSLRAADGSFSWLNLSLLVDVPVVFPMGGGYNITFPLSLGDEVLVVFSSRCIDGWWSQGGIQLPSEFRFHSLDDGFAIPGVRSMARPLASISTTSMQLRTDDGLTMIDLNGSTQKISLVAPGGVFINGIEFDTHIHGGVQSGGDVTGVPIP